MPSRSGPGAFAGATGIAVTGTAWLRQYRSRRYGPLAMPVARATLLALVTLIGACAVQPKTAAVLSNRITWSTASEVENFGYDVYRSDTETGPFVRLTPQPIAGAGTTDEEQFYEFVDDQIREGVSYYYYVESVSLSGIREKFTPVFRSRPKYGNSRHSKPKQSQ